MICPNCEKTFCPTRPWSKYCSLKCKCKWNGKVNADHIREVQKKYRRLHPEKVAKGREQTREWQITHRGQIHALYVSRYESFEKYLSGCLCGIKQRAKKAGLKTDIDHEFLMQLLEKQKYRCAATGILLAHEKRNPCSVSVDRIDSTKGYTKDNVQIVCGFYNYGKNKHPDAEALSIIEEIRQSGRKQGTETQKIEQGE